MAAYNNHYIGDAYVLPLTISDEYGSPVQLTGAGAIYMLAFICIDKRHLYHKPKDLLHELKDYLKDEFEEWWPRYRLLGTCAYTYIEPAKDAYAAYGLYQHQRKKLAFLLLFFMYAPVLFRGIRAFIRYCFG